MSHNFGYNFIRFVCFLLIVLVLYFAVSTVPLSSLSTYIGSVTIGGTFDQWSEGATPDGSVYNDGLGQFNDAFSGMLYNIAKILSYTHGTYNNAVTTNSYLAQIYTKVYDILDTLVNHASIVSSNFTLVRNALDGISGYLNNIMSYTASTRDNTLAIADRLMYNNLSAAEYLDSINSHVSAANNQIRTLHTDNLNSNRYLTEINGKLSYTYSDNTVHSISDIVYNNGVGVHTDLIDIKNNQVTNNNYSLSTLNKIYNIDWIIDNNSYFDGISIDDINYDNIHNIDNVTSLFAKVHVTVYNSKPRLFHVFLPVHFYNVLNINNVNLVIEGITEDYYYFVSPQGIDVYFVNQMGYGNAVFKFILKFKDPVTVMLSSFQKVEYLNFNSYQYFEVLSFLRSDYLKSIDSHLEDIHFTMTNPLVSYDDTNKVNVDISGSDTQNTGNIINKLRNIFSTGVSSGQFITTLDDTSFYQFFTSQIDSDLNDLSTTYNEPVY